MEFILYEVRYTIFDTFRSSWGLAEDDTIIGIANKRMATFLQLLIKFMENDITKEGAERTALRSAHIALLNDTIDHDTCFQILMYQ